MFKSPFAFSGRIRRTEYGISILIYIVVVMIVQFSVAGLADRGGPSVVLLLLILPCLWFVLAQGVKRSHDLGNSGWFILIPFYGLWLLFADSKPGINKYGPNPKGIGNETEFSFDGERSTI
jgi:uncharacterized membrane protein YhaH (DUF805 family)